MKKVIIFTFIGLLLGFGLGVVSNMVYIGYKISSTMFVLQEVELLLNEEAAIKAYLNEKPEVGIWAIENFINALNRVIEERREAGNDEYFFMIGDRKEILKYDHVRLALLYEKTGNDLKRKENFEKAFEYCGSNEIEKELLEDRLIKTVTQLDSEYIALDEQ